MHGLGVGSAALVAVLLAAYAITLATGFASLESGDEPIGDPYFTLLEILILLMVAVHSWAPVRLKTLSLASLIFMADAFFALSTLFASGVFTGSRLALSIRAAMLLSGGLALAGLSGVITGDMALRNIGIASYVGVFFIVVLLLGILFYRSVPVEAERTGRPVAEASRPTNKVS